MSVTLVSTLVRVGELTNRTFVLPVVIFFPTSRCNSRCVSCDWWKASGADDLTLDEIRTLAVALPDLGTRLVLFSGGEPLLRPDVFQVADLFRARGLTLHLHTSGLHLELLAAEVSRSFSRVIVSLDASSEALYRAIRGVDALALIERGVARLRCIAPDVEVMGRSTIHRFNFREVPRLIEHARAMCLDGISFLTADVSSTAFGRQMPPRAESLALTLDEVAEFQEVVDDVINRFEEAFESGFVTDPPEKLRRLPQYYAALCGQGAFPPVACNAPYMSVVIEANGTVRPCFFHDAVGHLRREPLPAIVRRNLPAFRATLSVPDNPVCRRCVCSMKTGWRNGPWS